MKCLRQNLQFSFLLFLVATVVFASCHQHTVAVYSKGAFGEKSSGKSSGEIVITVANFVNQASRTIAPGQLTGTNLQPANYKLRLTGTSGRVNLPEQELTLTNGKVTIRDVPEGLWELTLQATAVTASNGVNVGDVILEGKEVARVSNGSITDVMFTLRPLEAGNGSLQVTVNVAQGNRDAQYGGYRPTSVERTHVGLFVKGTDNLVAGFTDEFYDGKVPATFRYPRNGAVQLAAGEYELRMEFNVFDKLGAMWKEDVIVEPGRLTNGTFAVPHILKTPAQVRWASDLVTTNQLDNGLFEVTLKWDVTNTNTPSSNVSSYEIQLKQLPSSYTSPSNTRNEGEWDAQTGPVYTINGDPNSPYHFSNYMGTYPVALATGMITFDKATNSIKLLLASGKYAYRIRSIGSAGGQIWTYAYNNNGNLVNPIISPIPTPAIPTNYFTNLSVSGNSFTGKIIFNEVPYATGYDFQIARFTSRPSGNISNQYNDTVFTTNKVFERQNTPASIFNFTGNVGSFYLARVRARGISGISSWFYYPKYITKDGPQS